MENEIRQAESTPLEMLEKHVHLGFVL
jgi:hypothetical protein